MANEVQFFIKVISQFVKSGLKDEQSFKNAIYKSIHKSVEVKIEKVNGVDCLLPVNDNDNDYFICEQIDYLDNSSTSSHSDDIVIEYVKQHKLYSKSNLKFNLADGAVKIDLVLLSIDNSELKALLFTIDNDKLEKFILKNNLNHFSCKTIMTMIDNQIMFQNALLHLNLCNEPTIFEGKDMISKCKQLNDIAMACFYKTLQENIINENHYQEIMATSSLYERMVSHLK